ncbi:MAG: fluoride efflux transporter CrcB [Halobacteriaceae archaeon]
MSQATPAIVVGAGGVIGALLRHFVGQRLNATQFPLATITVNILGSFALGVVTFLGIDETLLLLIGTGVCGSFTTFSTFSYETVRLWEQQERTLAIFNAVGNLIGATVAIGLAWGLVKAAT